MMARDVVLVSHPDDVTSDWLAEVLGQDPDALASISGSPIGTGQVGENIRYVLEWVDGVDGPGSVVVKFPAFDETSRATGVATHSYEREVWFYRLLAATVEAPTPVCHHGAVVEGTAQMVLVLEDLAPAEQGDQLAGCDLDDARLAMDAVAGLHAPRFNDPTLFDLDWISRATPDRSQEVSAMFELLVPGFMARYADRLDDSVMRCVERFNAARGDYFLPWSGPLTLTHGDYRLDNLLFRRDGGGRPVSVVDWGGIGHGRPGADVGYFLGAGLLPEVAAEHELDLVEHYHRAMVERGVEGFDLEECQDDVRRGAFSGLVMAVVASQIVRQEARGDEMFCVMAERHAAQIERLDAFGAL